MRIWDLDQIEVRLEAVMSLTKLLLHEIESLAEMSATNGGAGNATSNLHDRVQQYEVALIRNALLESHGNQRKAAEQLGIKPSTLHAKIQRHEIHSLSLFGQFSERRDLEDKASITDESLAKDVMNVLQEL